MSARVERVRVGLIAGSVLLLMVLAGTYSYARYRAAKSWLNKMKVHSGISITQETDNYTYSQSLRGRTVFTLRAAKGFSHPNGDGLWTLHDVVITFFGLSGDRTDRVYGKTFEWDEKQGIARAIGEVDMDLQVPSGIAVRQRYGSPATAETADSIHVKTSGLTFVRKLGVAATQERIEFHYGGLTCVATGAEFDSNPSALHLLADVQMNGVLHGKPIALTATKADFDRASNVASFVRPLMTTEDRKARAESAVLHLRKDGSVERAEAVGGVVLDAATTHVEAPRLDAALNEKNQPQTARLSGGVKMVDSDAQRPGFGEAGEMRMRFDGEGRPAEVTAVNGAHVLSKEAGANGVWLEREMRGDQLVGTFHAEGKGPAQLKQVHAVGHASMRGDSVAKAVGAQPGGLKATHISGDDLLIGLAPGGAKQQVRLDKLHGVGRTVLRQTAALGEERTSSGDTLDMVFAADPKQAAVASATEVGHVVISSRAAMKPGAKKTPETTTANADRAAYDGSSERLALAGGVHIADGVTSMTAESAVVDQKTGDAEAHGNVSATLAGNGAQATHVAAQQAFLHKATEIAEFSGTPSKPARMWQEASQVEAATIVIDRQKNTLVAKPAVAGGTIHSVFAAEAKPAAPGEKTARPPSILRIESRQLEYSDALHDAMFTGPVKIDGSVGEISGQRTTVYFTPAAKGSGKSKVAENGLMGGALERVVVAGDVKMEQPGRHGTGDQLVYKAADGSFVLTGSPSVAPRVVDAQQGSVTGASLLFRAGDSTIVVTGAPAAEGRKPQRARIETRVRQKTE